jgi:PKD repeat protein
MSMENVGRPSWEVLTTKKQTTRNRASANQPWEPGSGNDWRTETIDLTDYLGSSVVFHFVNVSGYGNSLFIDNINVETILPPDAGLSSNATQVCKGDAVVFSDVSKGENLTYDWSFGTGAVPSTQDGPGPHIINFTEAGTNTVTLIVTNGAGSDTATLDIQVEPSACS